MGTPWRRPSAACPRSPVKDFVPEFDVWLRNIAADAASASRAAARWLGLQHGITLLAAADLYGREFVVVTSSGREFPFRPISRDRPHLG
eukprot:gene8374-7331_t